MEHKKNIVILIYFRENSLKIENNQQKEMAEEKVIAFFALAGFLGTVAFSATGFAMGIMFLFIYQIGSLAGDGWLNQCCSIRYAVFIQSIAFVVVIPVVLWRVNIRKNIRYDLLFGFVPITLVATPLGQYMQDYTPVSILKITVGIITVVIALWQIREYFVLRRKLRQQQQGMKKEDSSSSVEEGERNDAEEQMVVVKKKSSVDSKELTLFVNDDDDDGGQMKDQKDENLLNRETSEGGSLCDTIRSQVCPVMRPMMLWIMVAGFTSGFLGGLIGVRGPPLIVLFLFYEYPKSQIKASGAIVGAANVIVRVITYSLKPPPPNYPTRQWFTMDDTWLYVFVALSGLLACPLGFWLSVRIDQALFKMVLACLLIVNGITMIVTGSMEV